MSNRAAHAHVYHVDLGPRSYDIHIEPGCMGGLGRAMAAQFPGRGHCLVVSNDVVAPLYMDRVRQGLVQDGWRVSECILPDGERHKNVASWSVVLDALMAARLSRHEPLIALGGGVIGDTAGFAAACYRRGVPYVQVPTTLLAQVDSSVGGKTAVNHPLGKNMIGVFYQPRLVWIDPVVLSTLKGREFRAGIAEVIKYGLIRDAGFFHMLAVKMECLLALDEAILPEVILTSCRHKAEVVMADETEQGGRALLNLGHTFGHAVEAMTHYTEYLHGEGVALGTLMAARLSEQLGCAGQGLEQQICALYRKSGLPVEIPAFTADAWLDAMGHDKKTMGGRIRFVLLRDIGDAFLSGDVQEQDIRQLIQSYA